MFFICMSSCTLRKSNLIFRLVQPFCLFDLLLSLLLCIVLVDTRYFNGLVFQWIRTHVVSGVPPAVILVSPKQEVEQKMGSLV